LSSGERNGGFIPWYRKSETWLQFVLLLIMICVFYIFLEENMGGWQGIWVLVNVVGGYLILNKPEMRKKVRNIWRGVLHIRVWGYALFNLLLVAAAAGIMSLYMTSGGSDGAGSGGGGNPFVSNILLVVVLFPIIPLFADAETYLFQGLIIGLFLKREYVNCPECGKTIPPGVPCHFCGNDSGSGRSIRGPEAWLAVSLSAIVFAGAHMVLLMSFAPIILALGGLILGWAYLRKGHLFTARVHLVYDLVLICGLFFFYLLSEIGGF